MSATQAQKLYDRLKKEATEGGYILNPNTDFVLSLMEGLLENEKRVGYMACPCRLPDGDRAKDLDIICPCDYRDPDLEEFGTCYCALYVSQAVADGNQPLGSIPERRPESIENPSQSVTPQATAKTNSDKQGLTLWRCKVCGYLCARPQPPLKCPICKVDKDRFERIALNVSLSSD